MAKKIFKLNIKDFIQNILNINILNKKAEKVLFITLGFLVGTLISTQIGLINKSTRTYLTKVDKYEGINLKEITEVTNMGQLTLQIEGTKPNKKIKVLINGLPEYEFDKEIIIIQARNNSLIEVDGSKLKNQFKVKIIRCSDNILKSDCNKIIDINSNIEILTRVFLE